MSRTTVTICITLMIVIASFASGAFTNPGAFALQIHDQFDQRPSRKVLLLGNSRTFFNDMPQMVRRLADSADDDYKWQITMEAPAGGSFEILATQDRNVPELLSQDWDDIVLQSESRHVSGEDRRASFRRYGGQLLQAANPQSGKPWLIINWVYDLSVFVPLNPPGTAAEARRLYFNDIQTDSKALARSNNARTINIGVAWQYVIEAVPGIRLTTDGNHPTAAGSYIEAFAIYAALAPERAAKATYVPDGVNPALAATIREKVLAAHRL